MPELCFFLRPWSWGRTPGLPCPLLISSNRINLSVLQLWIDSFLQTFVTMAGPETFSFYFFGGKGGVVSVRTHDGSQPPTSRPLSFSLHLFTRLLGVCTKHHKVRGQFPDSAAWVGEISGRCLCPVSHLNRSLLL